MEISDKENLERNRKNAIAFYHMIFNECKVEESVKLYVGDTYTQHNPMVGDGI